MVSQPTTAGVAQCVIDWSVGLAERGWDVTVACPDGGDLADWCAAQGIERIQWESQRSPFADVPGETAALRRILAQVKPDLVMLHSSKAGLVGRLALRGTTPTVFVPHAWSFDAATGKAAKAALAWERIAAWRWTDLVLCVSTAEYQRGVSVGIRATYQVTRNGVDIAGVRAAAAAGPSRLELCGQLGVSPDVLLAVCLGRLAEQKGQDVLVAAWPMVPGGSNRQLVFVGDGPDADYLLIATAGDASVTFTGGVPRNEALAWLAAADLVVVPSRWEGMALVPLEALALGTPVVASDVTGLREAVSAEVGQIVPADEPAALASAVSDWLGRATGPDGPQVSAAAKDWAEVHFSLESTVTAIDRALRDVQIRRGT